MHVITLGEPGFNPEEKEGTGQLVARCAWALTGSQGAPIGRFALGEWPKIGASSLHRRPASHRTWYGVRTRRGLGKRLIRSLFAGPLCL